MRTWTRLARIATFSLMATAVGAQVGTSRGAAQTRTTEAHAPGLEQVQKTLRQQGHDPGPVDGRMGPRTTAALKAFQREHGLAATGHLDGPTLARLGLGGNASDRVPRPSSDATSQAAASETQTGGDTRPSPADPAQGHKTGGNVGEGASYSRSTEKPQPPK